MRYTLRQLEIFIAASHFENISKAANYLSMSQSAASSGLKDFETQFDIRLFDRVGKRLKINELGRMIRPQAEALLARANEFQVILEEHREVGLLKVGATLSIGNYLAVNIMADFMRANPQSKVTLEVANTMAIAEKVKNFELDIGLIEGELNSNDLEVIPWRDDELTVFASPNHGLANKKKLLDSDLIQAQWILREPGSGTRQTFERAMGGIMPELNVVLELQHTEAIKRAVEAQLGVACISKVTLEDAFKRKSLVPLNVPHRDFKRKFYFIIHKHKYRSAGIERWMEFCGDYN